MGPDERIRVYLHFQTTDAPWGGGNNFLRALKKVLPRHGGVLAESINDEYDVFLFNNGYEAPGRYMDLKKLASIRRYGTVPFWVPLAPLSWIAGRGESTRCRARARKVMVHRLDGISRLYGRAASPMDELQVAANRFADFTIFQSRFCLESFQNEGYESRDYAIIGNGADPEIFHPPDEKRGEPAGPLRLAASAWSGNPKKGHATLAEISEIQGVSITFIGRWPEGIDPKQVRCVGALPQPEVAEVLRDQDAFIHAAENDPCPNVVYEALSCGLPVLYRHSGGTPEIAEGYGMPLETPYRDCLDRFRNQLITIRGPILADRQKFSIDRACREYLEVFRQLTG